MQAICIVDSSFIDYPVNICIKDTVGLKKIKQKDGFRHELRFFVVQ